MRISTKGRYGLRVMMELALREGGGPTMTGTIARSQEISKNYLHNLLGKLRAAGLVRSIRGSGGGYVLARPASGIRVSEIVRTLEGAFFPVDCVGDRKLCERADRCAAREVWCDLGKVMEEVLSAITLEQLASRQRVRDAKSLTYQI
ncbi:MAG: RrF2 family transcriptional regulator [Planctomycetota bacterium]